MRIDNHSIKVGASNVERVTIENLEAELFNQCPDITSYDELEAFATRVGEWALMTTKMNADPLKIEADEDVYCSTYCMEHVVSATELSDMHFMINGHTFSALDIFNYICPGVSVKEAMEYSTSDLFYHISFALSAFLDEYEEIYNGEEASENA